MVQLEKNKMQQNNTEIILASASPRRQIILQQIGISFKVIPADIDEDKISSKNAKTLVKKLALIKAKTIKENHPASVIIAADTVVCHKGDILGKPRDYQHAKDILKSLSGNTHCVYTGVCVFAGNKCYLYSVKSKVTFENLNDNFIKYYVDNYPVLDKAGAYGIQEGAFYFIHRIRGEISNVIGLPTNRLKHILKMHNLLKMQ